MESSYPSVTVSRTPKRIRMLTTARSQTPNEMPRADPAPVQITEAPHGMTMALPVPPETTQVYAGHARGLMI